MTDVRRLQGSIRKLKPSFGFIAGDDGQDYFLHWSGMVKGQDFRKIELQDRLEFDVVPGKDGKVRAVQATKC